MVAVGEGQGEVGDAGLRRARLQSDGLVGPFRAEFIDRKCVLRPNGQRQKQYQNRKDQSFHGCI